MGQTYKADFNVDNGTDFDKYNFSTSADQVSYAKNGKETNVQTELDALNTGKVSMDDRAIVFKGPTTGVKNYPAAVGIYRLTGGTYSWLPSGANDYGTLVIMGGGYYINIYMDVYAQAWIGYSTEADNNGKTVVTQPAQWRKITT